LDSILLTKSVPLAYIFYMQNPTAQQIHLLVFTDLLRIEDSALSGLFRAAVTAGDYVRFDQILSESLAAGEIAEGAVSRALLGLVNCAPNT
jgi:hypothetical protein